MNIGKSNMMNGQNALTANGAVCRKWRCGSSDSLWDFGSFVARPNGSEPPPAASRQTLHASGGKRGSKSMKSRNVRSNLKKLEF
jgi:hypothetical protein